MTTNSCTFYATLLRAGAVLTLAAIFLVPGSSYAQEQLIAYVDSEEILGEMPDYAGVQQRMERQAEEWRGELSELQDALEEMFREYQARELLYTREERQAKRESIAQAEEELQQLRMRYFGPQGEFFARQEQLMRPIQERILEAIEEVAAREGYAYVFDQSGDFLFMYADEEFDITDIVLAELGIDLTPTTPGS